MTSNVFKLDGGICYAGHELFQVKEETEEQPRLGLVGWTNRHIASNAISLSLRGHFEPANIKDMFLIWMDEKQIKSSCPQLLERFLEGRTTSRTVPPSKEDEDKATEEEMKADAISLVERCKKVLERYKSPETHGNNAMIMLTNNIAVLAAYAKVPELSQCLLDSGVVQLLADALMNSYREEELHENASKVLHALVSHMCSNKSAEIILQLINVISDSFEEDDLMMLSLFEGVTLTVVELFASTVKKDCCPSLEQMTYSEVFNKLYFLKFNLNLI